ncbi:MAG: hypothetical protein ACJ752_00605 [Gaiellaceae bacterium]
MSDPVLLPEWASVWRVEVPPETAAELGERVGHNRRAGQVEVVQPDGPPTDARLFRVEPDEPVAVLVEKTWPLPYIGQRHKRAWAMLRSVEPVKQPPDYEGPLLLAHVAAMLREAGAFGDVEEEQF